MRRLTFVLTALTALAVVPGLDGHTAAPRDPPRSVADLMKRKLGESQKVLAGIALHDFDQVANHAEELLLISQQAEWNVLKTPQYEMYSNEFRDIARGLVGQAKKKNVDACALSYVELTLSCVKCHKHVREKRMTRLDHAPLPERGEGPGA